MEKPCLCVRQYDHNLRGEEESSAGKGLSSCDSIDLFQASKQSGLQMVLPLVVKGHEFKFKKCREKIALLSHKSSTLSSLAP
jgi:hypothetical protein